MQLGYIFLAISIFGFGISNCLWVAPLKHLTIWQVIFCRSFINVIIILGYSFYLYKTNSAQGLINLNGITVLFTAKCILLCCYSYFGLVFYNLSLKQKTLVSMAVPLTCLSSVFGIMLSYIVYRATLSPIQGLIFILFTVAVFITENNSLKQANFKFSKGTLLALSAAFVWGTSFALFPPYIKAFGAILFSIIVEVVVCGFSLFIILVKYKSFTKLTQPFNYFFKILPISVFGCLGIIFTNIATQHLPMTTIFAFEPLTPIISIIGGLVLLKEQLKTNQLIAISIIIVSFIILKLL